MTERLFKGGCLCGAVRFEARGEPRGPCYCHCRSCQGASGAPFVAWCTFDRQDLAFTRGELTVYASSEGVERGFCGHCGTTISYRRERLPLEIDISLTTLVDAGRIQPERHIWVADKAPWLTIDDSLPQFEGWSES